MYSTIILSKRTDFSQTKANWECVHFFWTLLISFHIIFHGWQRKTGLFGKRYTSPVHSLYSVWEKWACPSGKEVSLRAEFPYRVLACRRSVWISKAIQKSTFSFFFFSLLISKGAVKSLFFGGHCVLVARLSFVVEKRRYSVFFGMWATQ